MFSRNEDLPVVQTRNGHKREPQSDPAVLKVAEYTYRPGVVLEGHAHSTPGLSYIVKGKVRVRIGEAEMILGPGSYFYTGSGVWHNLEEIIEETTQILVSVPLPEAQGGAAQPWMHGAHHEPAEHARHHHHDDGEHEVHRPH